MYSDLETRNQTTQKTKRGVSLPVVIVFCLALFLLMAIAAFEYISLALDESQKLSTMNLVQTQNTHVLVKKLGGKIVPLSSIFKELSDSINVIQYELELLGHDMNRDNSLIESALQNTLTELQLLNENATELLPQETIEKLNILVLDMRLLVRNVSRAKSQTELNEYIERSKELLFEFMLSMRKAERLISKLVDKTVDYSIVSADLTRENAQQQHDHLIELHREFMLIFTVSSVVALIILFVVYATIKFRMHYLHEYSKRVESGDYSARVKYVADDIIGKVTVEIENMSRKLSSLVKESEYQGDLARQAQQLAEEANQSKSRFLASMSHEIRTPLTAIIGFSENLSDEHLGSDELRESADIITRNSRHLLSLINDILDISKIESGKLQLEHIDTDVPEIIHDVYQSARNFAQSKQIEFGVLYINPIPKRIHSDPTRLKQILFNLVNNAIKFTDRGHVTLRVRHNSQNHMLIIDVIDSGMGLTAEQLANLFNAFVQADKSTTRKYGGTGLGLFLSKKLAKNLGGDIVVNSVFGKGSCFTMSVASGDVSDREYIEIQNIHYENASAMNMNEAQELGLLPQIDEPTDNESTSKMMISNLLYEDSDHDLRDYIKQFAESLDSSIATLKNNLHREQWKALNNEATQLLEASTSYGYPELVSCIEQFVDHLPAKDGRQLYRILNEIKNIHQEIQNGLCYQRVKEA